MMTDRERALESVTAALPVLKQINDLYLRADDLNRRAQQQWDDHAQFQAAEESNLGVPMNNILDVKGYMSWKQSGAFMWTVAGIMGGVFVGFFLSTILKELRGFPLLGDLFDFAGGMAPLVCMIGGGYLGHNKSKADVAKRVDQHALEAQARVDALKPEMERISQQIYWLTMENQAVLDPLPRDYRYYDAAVFFENVLANERADSMKEALNLYVEHVHRQALESQNQQLLEQSRQQSAMMADIERSARATAVNTGISATFSILNFLSNC